MGVCKEETQTVIPAYPPPSEITDFKNLKQRPWKALKGSTGVQIILLKSELHSFPRDFPSPAKTGRAESKQGTAPNVGAADCTEGFPSENGIEMRSG